MQDIKLNTSKLNEYVDKHVNAVKEALRQAPEEAFKETKRLIPDLMARWSWTPLRLDGSDERVKVAPVRASIQFTVREPLEGDVELLRSATASTGSMDGLTIEDSAILYSFTLSSRDGPDEFEEALISRHSRASDILEAINSFIERRRGALENEIKTRVQDRLGTLEHARHILSRRKYTPVFDVDATENGKLLW